VAPDIDGGADVVFVARRGILHASLADLEREIRTLLAQSNLLAP
jgi:RNase P protein component